MCNIIARRYGRLLERLRNRATEYHVEYGDHLLLTEAIEAIQALEGELDSARMEDNFKMMRP